MLRVCLFVIVLTAVLPAVPLRVATFNIETQRNEDGWPNFALGPPGEVHFDSVAAILGRIDAEVVALQEVHTSDIDRGYLAALGAAVGLPHQFAATNSGSFDSNLRVVFLSRYPFLSTSSITSPPGAKEMSRHAPAVVVDVPGTANDPLLISAHLKAGTSLADRFRRAIEMKRLADHLGAPGSGGSDNFIVLGDFNPSATGTTFSAEPSGLPTTFALGSDVTFPVTYSTLMPSYFPPPEPVAIDARQLDGNSGTFWLGQTLDLIMVSPALAGRPHATEIYNSLLDGSNATGLPKAGAPLDATTSSLASDHFAVFGDFQLDQEAFNLGLSASAPQVAEDDPPGTVTLTVTLAAPAPSPLSVTISSDDPKAVAANPVLQIPAGDLAASTAVTTSRDFLAGGSRTVTFTASATGYADGTAPVVLLDSDGGYVFTEPWQEISEDFDGFGGGHDPAPWTSGADAWLGTDDGGSAAVGARSYGGAAPGFIGGGGEMVLETDFTNGTDQPLTILDLAYDAAQWRAVFGGAADRIEVELVAGGVVIPVPALAFEARTDLPTGAVPGGMPVTLSGRMSGFAIPPGEGFGLRFRFVSGPASAPLPDDVFVNEIHYDNVGADVGEFVEVVVGPGFESLLGSVELHLYNGANGRIYGDTHPLTSFVEGATTSSGHRFFSKEIPGIQNGAPDGMALVVGGSVVEFLSYEGDFVAEDGPAAGMTSVDVGVSQTGSEPVGERSIGRTAGGTAPGDFEWVRFDAGVAHSPGEPNQGQAILAPGVPSQGLAVNRVVAKFVPDSDGDGLGDDVDPDPASIFRPRVGFGTSGPEIRFAAGEGASYTIEWCDDLVSWDHSATVTGDGGEMVFPLPAGGNRLFVRVRVGR